MTKTCAINLHEGVAEVAAQFARANFGFRREGNAATGRRSQTWLRTDGGWRVWPRM